MPWLLMDVPEPGLRVMAGDEKIGVQLIKVDVIMAVFNAEATVEASIRSAMHQTMPPMKSPDGKVEVYGRGVHFDICVCAYNE